MKAKDQCLARCQKEHEQWRAEHASWLAEIKKWRRNEQQALALLFRLEQALPDYRMLLDQHHDEIRDHEGRLDAHKKRLTEYQRKDMDEAHYAELMDAHRHDEEQHARVEQLHADLRLKITAAMSELSHLASLLIVDKEA